MPKILLAFLLLWSLIANSVKSFAQNDIPLYNAYYMAKAIGNAAYTDNKKVDTLRRILGGSLWYSSNEMQSVTDIDTLLNIMTKYPVLRDRLKVIVDTLYKQVSLDGVDTATIIKAFGKDTNSDVLKKVLDLKREIDTRRATIKELQPEKDRFNIIYEELQRREIVKEQIIETLNYRLTEAQIDSLNKSLGIDSLDTTANRSPFDVNRYNLAWFTLRSKLDELMKIKLSKGIIKNLNNTRPDYNSNSSIETETQKVITSFSTVEIDASVNSFSQATPLSFQMPSQSQAIDALAIYLAKRVKQESVMWFFQVLEKNMSSYELTKSCFPNCFALLQSNEVYEVPKMGASWRYAISKDFTMMPINIFKSNWLKAKLGNNSGVAQALETSWKISQMITQKYSFHDMITTLYTDVPVNSTLSVKYEVNLHSLISLLYMINEEMYQLRGKTVQRLQYADLLRMSDEEFTMMLSLLDMKYNNVIRNVFFADPSKMTLEKAAQLMALRKWFGSVLLKIQQIDNIRNGYNEFVKMKQNNADAQFEYTDYSTWKFMKDLFSSLDFSSLAQADSLFKPVNAAVKNVITTISNVQEVFSLLEQKNFAGSVNKLFELTDKLANQDSINVSKEVFVKYLNNTKLKYYKEATEFITVQKVQAKFGFRYDIKTNTVSIDRAGNLGFIYASPDKEAINVVKKLAGFLNDVSYTQNSKDLSRVIEAYSMPPGSYKRKRATWLSVDLNAYVGAYAGYEWTKIKNKSGNDSSTTNGGVYGLSAPVGISFSKTFGKKIRDQEFAETINDKFAEYPERIRLGRNNMWKQSATTVSLFLSIIDIGAVVSYRFSSNEETLPQQVKWTQVISPGLHLNIGIKNTPLVFSTGYQYTPKLRKLKDLKVDEQLNANRFYGGLLFDLPLYNLVSKTVSRIKYR